MQKKIYKAADGAEIAYFIEGKGPAILCMHGSGRDHTIWEKNGWIGALATRFTVIAMDIRGFGESSIFHEKKYYEINRILDDIKGIMKECGFEEWEYIGHSYGGTIGFQAIRAGLPITKAVFASGSMDRTFFEEICPEAYQEYQELAEIKRTGEYDQLTGYSEEDIAFIKEEDMEKFEALFGAWKEWKSVDITDLKKCKVAIYSGTLDHNKEMVTNTTTECDRLNQFGIETKCFEGINHEELVTKMDVCYPWVSMHL